MTIRAQLHVTGPGINRLFVLDIGQTGIGRSFENAIWLDHPLLSQLHAEILRTEDAVTLTDLDTSQGTRLNGRSIPSDEPQPLKSGDVILIHPYTLAFAEIVTQQTLNVLTPDMLAGGAKLAKDGDEEDGEDEDDISVTNLLPQSLLSGPPELPDYTSEPPPGLNWRSIRYINYLPAIYHTDFVSRFLGMTEAILMPVEWTINNIDLQLDPQTGLVEFLPWLASWFNLSFDSTWTEEMQRTFLEEAYQLYAMRGTKWSQTRMLEIYLGKAPEIIDLHDDENPFLFLVKIPVPERRVNRILVEQMIEMDKPAHTTYKLEFRSRRKTRMADVFSELDK